MFEESRLSEPDSSDYASENHSQAGCGVGVAIDGAGNQHVESGFRSFARGGHEVHARQGAELGANQDTRTPLRFAFLEAAFGADIFAGPGL
jgi:hypothetical protein